MSMSALSRRATGRIGTLTLIGGVVALAFVFSMFSASPATAKEKTINLRFSSSFMPPEPPNVYANHTLDLVEKKSNGRVKIERFMGGALGGPHEQLDLASTGAADIISLHVDQFSQQLPLHQITNTEQLTTAAEGLSNVIALVHELPETKPILDAEQQKNNIKILHFYCNGPTAVTTKFPASTLADIKGKKINVIAAFQRDVFKELGWIPVNVQIPELYEALSRGVIDGIFMATAANVPLKWYEIGNAHLILGNNTMISSPLAFNLDRWNKLPEDIQKIFMESAYETAQWSVEQINIITNMTYEKFKAKGAAVVEVPDNETNMLFEILFKYSIINWMKNCSAAGVEKEATVIQKYWDQMKWGKFKK